MRGNHDPDPMLRSLLLALVLAIGPLLAGCLGDDGPVEESGFLGASGLAVDELPAGATLERIPGGLRLVWTDLELPTEERFTVPQGATMVRATVDLGANRAPVVELVHAETGRRRCQQPYTTAWDQPLLSSKSCAALTVVDHLPAPWVVKLGAGSSPSASPLSDDAPPVARRLTVDLLTAPVDGLAARLDLTELSRPVLDVVGPETATITSFDGTSLYAEVTLPDAPGPFPVVVSSSPYLGGAHVRGEPGMWEYFVHDFAARGYAVVLADVRGTGHSGGCMEVWGPNERRDQAALVAWAAEQPWSDGKVGFYGQSYLATTAMEAAALAPEALKAVIAVAPVVDPYRDWHFGGVPNGENVASPLVGYQVFTGALAGLDAEDPQSLVEAAGGVCDPTLSVRANDPRALYNTFYEERNLTLAAGDVTAAVLYTQGFFDSNVKSSQAQAWFNALSVPKLGLFGPWVHQHPTRADQEVLFLAWFEEHLKGKDLGLDALPPVHVSTAAGTVRAADAWPPTDAQRLPFYPDFAQGTLVSQPEDGASAVLLDPTGASAGQSLVPVPSALRLTTELSEHVLLSGASSLDLSVTLSGASNAHVAAFLHQVDQDGRSELVTWGMANLAHRNGHDRYAAVPPGERVAMTLPMLPVEHVLEAGATLVLEVRTARLDDWFLVSPAPGATMTLHGGPEGTALRLPTVPVSTAGPLPASATT